MYYQPGDKAKGENVWTVAPVAALPKILVSQFRIRSLHRQDFEGGFIFIQVQRNANDL